MCKQKNPNIRIRRMMLANYKELRHIGINKGPSFSVFMKVTLTQIADSFPAELKAEKKLLEKETIDELIVRGISVRTYTELTNIAENLGVCLGCLIKIESKKISYTYPARLKAKPLD